MLKQVVQNNFRNGVFLQNNYEALTGSTRCLITDVGDAAKFSELDELGDFLGEVIWVDLVWKFGDYETGAVVQFFNIDNRSHRD